MHNHSVHWRDGLYLLPQHFQAAEKYFLESIHLAGKLDHEYNYGIKSLDFNRDEIANSHFFVVACQMRTRDGTIVSLGPGQSLDRIALRNAESEFEDAPSDLSPMAVSLQDMAHDNRLLRVYIAIPLYRSDGGNVATAETLPADAELQRFREFHLERPDESCGENYRPIGFKIPQIRLVTAPPDQRIPNFETLPIAQINLEGDQGPELDESYIPPLLAIDAWPPLHIDIIRYIYNRIGNRLQALSEFAEGQGITWATADGTGQEHLAWLSLLGESQSSLHAIVFARGIHPFIAYSELCRIVGRLSVFHATRRPPDDLPHYDHDNLGRVFRWFKTAIDDLLDVPGHKHRFEVRPFVGAGEQMQVTLKPAWIETGWKWYVGVKYRNISELECHETLRNMKWKLASDRQVEMLYKSQNPGLHLNPLGNRTPTVLPVEHNLTYYDVVRSPEVVWDDVVATKTLAMRFRPQLVENRKPLDGQVQLDIKDDKERKVKLRFFIYAVPPESS